MRVVFLGNAEWSVPSLQAVAESSHEVVLVTTRVPRPAGRGNRPRPTPVSEAAGSLGLRVSEIETVKRGPGFAAIAEARPDVLTVVAYGEILPQAVLDVPSVAPVNVHFSLLPELRGAAPVQRAIMEGMTATGVSTIRMDAGMDTGPILLRQAEAIDPEDDAGSLGARLAAIGGRLLVGTLDRLQSGTAEEHPQDEAAATFAPKLRPEERLIPWDDEVASVLRRVRALAPEPAATTIFRGRGLKVFRAVAVQMPAGLSPGRVVIASGQGLAVSAADGAVALIEVGQEGRRRMSGAEFVRGHRPEIGEILG
jgi:methionyl-tRNA formyltransferase